MMRDKTGVMRLTSASKGYKGYMRLIFVWTMIVSLMGGKNNPVLSLVSDFDELWRVSAVFERSRRAC